MSIISLKCKNCNGSMNLDMNSKTCTCSHCGSTFFLSELVDEKDMIFVDKLNQNDLSKRVDFNDAIKSGDICLIRGEFLKAEEFFKKAIELDEKNYKGYFGVVRAKTHNFNILPDSNDYQEFATITKNLVDKDDESFVANELDKLEILKTEKQQIEKIKAEKEKTQKLNKKSKASFESFLTKFSYVLVVVFTAGIIFAIFLTKGFSKDNNASPNNIEISSVEEFKQLYQNTSALSSTIVLKSDLDFKNDEISPLGTSENPFTGNFYGYGKKISNLSIKHSTDSNDIGIFGYIKNANISGIILENVSFSENITNSTTGVANIGLICGTAENSSIKKCAVHHTSKIACAMTGHTTFNIGGLVGKLLNSNIAHSYSKASLNVDLHSAKYNSLHSPDPLEYTLGGLVGKSISSKISTSYSSSAVVSNIFADSSLNNNFNIYSSLGGIVGEMSNSGLSDYHIKSCFFSGYVSGNVLGDNLNASNKHCYVSGIVGHGVSSRTTQIESNYAMFSGRNYKVNLIDISAINLGDFYAENDSILYVADESIMIEEISKLFPSSIWKNTNTVTPQLIFA